MIEYDDAECSGAYSSHRESAELEREVASAGRHGRQARWRNFIGAFVLARSNETPGFHA